MSLSSKLRNFNKELKKKEKERKTNNGKTKSQSEKMVKGPSIATLLSDEQLTSIARHMPRDADSLGKYLSPEQMDAFGEDLLAVTCGHTGRDQAKFEECLLEIDAFVRGGVPGMALLDRVYPTILKHYGVIDDAEEVLETLKLYMNAKENKLKRKWVKDEEEAGGGGGQEDEMESSRASQKRQKTKGPGSRSSSQ